MRLILEEKFHEIADVWTFRFQPEMPMQWNAGQFMRFEIPHDKPDSKGIERWFTVSSAPYEGKIQITTRISNSTLKQALNTLPVNGIIVGDSLGGEFTWHEDGRPMLFVAGGIGITPFHAILKQRAHDKLPLKVHLIYASRDENIIFRDELKEWEKQFPELKVDYFNGEPVNTDLLYKAEPNLNKCLVYLSGAAPMVSSLGKELVEKGLPKSELMQDFLDGYTADTF